MLVILKWNICVYYWAWHSWPGFSWKRIFNSAHVQSLPWQHVNMSEPLRPMLMMARLLGPGAISTKFLCLSQIPQYGFVVAKSVINTELCCSAKIIWEIPSGCCCSGSVQAAAHAAVNTLGGYRDQCLDFSVSFPHFVPPTCFTMRKQHGKLWALRNKKLVMMPWTGLGRQHWWLVNVNNPNKLTDLTGDSNSSGRTNYRNFREPFTCLPVCLHMFWPVDNWTAAGWFHWLTNSWPHSHKFWSSAAHAAVSRPGVINRAGDERQWLTGQADKCGEWLVTALPLIASRHLVLAQYRADAGVW